MSEELQTVGDKFRCDKGGTCMALPKGSVIPQWWDPAMEKFKESGDYAKWCKEASEKFGCKLPSDMSDFHPQWVMLISWTKSGLGSPQGRQFGLDINQSVSK